MSGQASNVAAAIFYAVTQPDRVAVNEILIRPTDQTQPQQDARRVFVPIHPI